MLHFKLNMFRRALDAELKECCADGVADKTKKDEKEAIKEEEKILCSTLFIFPTEPVWYPCEGVLRLRVQ